MKRNFSIIQKLNAKNLRNNATLPEQILWNKLRKSQFNNLKFRRQQPVGKYIVDFICCSEKIIIELDGGQHNEIKNINYDKIRDNFLQQEGYTVIRIWDNDILNNIDNVMEYINNKIKSPTRKLKISTLPSREGTKNIKIQCPAKINLTLKITGKRDDGFHNLDSIMQTINLFDYLTISVEKSDKTEIILSGTSDEIPYNEKNLAYKAAKLFLDMVTSPLEGCKANTHSEASSSEPVCEGPAGAEVAVVGESRTNAGEGYKISIYIEKNIPVAAGLAGGSTDAAGTLYGLNKIFNEPLSRKELHELCAKLGSDLNLCLEGGRQKTSGRGEILEPLPFEEFDVSLIKPINLGISAKEAYTKFGGKMNNIDPAPKSEISWWDTTRSDFVNDLEWAVIDDYKELQHIKQKYPTSVMSGSGSTYFGLGIDFENENGFWVKNGLKSIPNGVKEI